MKIITIITVCFNAEKTIEETLKSVLKQNYKNIEYIVKDGNSIDNTQKIIEKYIECFQEKNIKFIYLKGKDDGIYDTMNKATEISTGEYLFYLGADDVLIENSIESLMKFVNKLKKGNNIILLPVEIKDENKIIGYINKKKLKIGHHQGVLLSREQVIKFEGYSSKYKIHSDFDLMSKCLKEGNVFEYFSPICSFRKGGLSTSGLKYKQSIKELNTIYLKYWSKIYLKYYLTLLVRPYYYYLKNILRKEKR